MNLNRVWSRFVVDAKFLTMFIPTALEAASLLSSMRFSPFTFETCTNDGYLFSSSGFSIHWDRISVVIDGLVWCLF